MQQPNNSTYKLQLLLILCRLWKWQRSPCRSWRSKRSPIRKDCSLITLSYRPKVCQHPYQSFICGGGHPLLQKGNSVQRCEDKVSHTVSRFFFRPGSSVPYSYFTDPDHAHLSVIVNRHVSSTMTFRPPWNVHGDIFYLWQFDLIHEHFVSKWTDCMSTLKKNIVTHISGRTVTVWVRLYSVFACPFFVAFWLMYLLPNLT